MEHISNALPKGFQERLQAERQKLRDRLPKLAGVPDEAIAKMAGKLYDAAECRERCHGCIDFAGCWREGEGRGRPASLRFENGMPQVAYVECGPFKTHQAEEQQRRLLQLSGMTAGDMAFTFDNFPVAQRDAHLTIYNTTLTFAEQYDGISKGVGLYLQGPPGIAKTHLMLAAFNRLKERGILAVMIRADALIDQLRDAIRRGEDKEAVLQRYIDAPVLGIDEIAQEPLTDFSLQAWLRLLSARLRDGKPTWFTSNFLPTDAYKRHYKDENAEQIDALRSRLYQIATLAVMVGDDHRQSNLRNTLGPERSR